MLKRLKWGYLLISSGCTGQGVGVAIDKTKNAHEVAVDRTFEVGVGVDKIVDAGLEYARFQLFQLESLSESTKNYGPSYRIN